MDELVDKTSRLAIRSETADSYNPILQTFETITGYARKLRGDISRDEITVTKQPASPFTAGGVVILLQEPLANHPWSRGINRVISDCPTLDALEEGVQLCSQGTLSLATGVSLIDVRPFISKTDKVGLSDAGLQELYRLVGQFIIRKQPHTVLCMGRDAQRELGRWSLGDAIKVIPSSHPSRVLNYRPHCTDVKQRQQLLKSILDAVGCCKETSQILDIFESEKHGLH
ncbi:hypothetical protein BJX64DRAFT_272470 [Aspergillus heterothallicus]